MDYGKYKLSWKEVIVGILMWTVISAVLAYFFYKSVAAFVILFMGFPIFLIRVKKRLKDKRKWKMTLEFKEMVRFLSSNSLDTVGTEAKRYLVDERNIITDPEYIYWDNGCENVYWTFNPSQEENNDLLKLAEFILEHTDTRDTYAVRAAYEFYKRAKTGEVDTKGLYTILKENNYETKTVYCENQTANRPKEEKESGKGKRIWGKILSLKKEATHKDEEWLKEIDKPCSEEMPFISEERQNITHENTENTSLLSKEAENTTLLCRKTGERRLVSKDNGDEISLKAYPCLIGARNPDVDIKLVNNTVSRMHAQIDLFNEKYYLYDLSSSNGTFLNGVKLESEEKEVVPGDEVCFGNARFVFM